MARTESPRSAGPTAAPRSSADGRRLVVSGAGGRLGRAVAAEAVAGGWTISGAVGGARSSRGRPTLQAFAGIDSTTAIDPPEALPRLLAGASVYVGTAPAPAERRNLEAVVRAGVPAVVATTGFSAEDERWLNEAAGSVPLVVDANFSLGMAWLIGHLAGGAPPPDGFDLALVEAHRRGKLDRPSGTARRWVQALEENSGVRSIGALPSIEISSVRAGELPGVHQLWIAGPHELIRIEHVAFDRGAFAQGIVRAAERLTASSAPVAPGRYTLAGLLEAAPEPA